MNPNPLMILQMKNKWIVLLLYVCVSTGVSGTEYSQIYPVLQEVHAVFYQKILPLWQLDECLEPKLAFVDAEKEKAWFFSLDSREVHYLGEKSWDKHTGVANSVMEIENDNYVTLIYDTWKTLSSLSQPIFILHELFHLYQDLLNISSLVSENYHLDTPTGRALFEIELQLLNEALRTEDYSKLSDAIRIRLYRQSLFPENNEEPFELHEGLAEYTGVVFAVKDLKKYLLEKNESLELSGLTNSFAYITGPIYGYFLDILSPGWQSAENLQRGLPVLLADQMGWSLEETPAGISEIERIKAAYDLDRLIAAYQEKLPDLSFYQSLLRDEVEKLYIRNNGLQFLFNPNDEVFSLAGEAVLLKKVTLQGNWGNIEVEKEIIRMNDWSAFILPPPSIGENGEKIGNGYSIHLNPGYEIVKTNGIYQILSEP